jgi:hypothetical protein
VLPIGVEDRSLAGVEVRRILERAHGGFHGIERIAAVLQDRMAALQGELQRIAIGLLTLGRHQFPGDGARASMHGQGDLAHGSWSDKVPR